MRRLFALVLTSLSFVSASLYGQDIITGVVTDSFTGEPLPYATVYVNGTTNGTTTAEDGRFELKDVSYPATVVFSFVGYEPQAHDYYRNPGDLTIKLKTSELPEIEVSGKIAKKDLTYFKRMFLGDDLWGRHATILNQSAIVIDSTVQITYQPVVTVRNTFSTEYYTLESYTTSKTITDTISIKNRLFTAWATEPLVIDLPLLGYIVYVDLVKFNVLTTGNITSCDILGYFYYKPYENLSKRRQQRIEENRRRAYYGSSQHFLRSIYQNSLSENGYVISIPQTIVKGKRKINTSIPVDMDSHSTLVADNMMQIHGLKDQTVKIRYYHEPDWSPLAFKRWAYHMYAESGITFLNDTCTFFKDGTLADNNIRFTGDLSQRKVGSCLPDDYALVIDTTKTYLQETENYTQDMLKYVDNIHNFNNMFPQEKVWLEFDNTAYFQGEDIWFKAFVTDATSLDQAPSQVLYVDFMAPTGQLLKQQKLKLVGGQADGRIPLLSAGTAQSREKQGVLAYPSGFYEIRAYTQNMLDFSPEAMFSRVIPVYTQPKYVGEYDRSYVETDYDNPLIKDLRFEPKKKQRKLDYDIEFYPEGGNLVADIPNRVGFKVTDSDGFGVDLGLYIPGVRDTVYTVHDGMGSFIFTPYAKNDIYYNTPDNKEKHLTLETTLRYGYSMIADMLSDSLLQVNIWRTKDFIGESIALAATCRGDVIYFKEIKSLDNAQLMIDCSEWPAGVCRLTLFNREGMILSSRSIFHNNQDMDGPIITVNTDSLSHDAFSKQVLELKLTGKAGNPIHDRFCLSVRDASDYGGGQSDNLKTNLLLSSDLRGYIHDPAWYLETYDDEHREALNLLTLIQGWERYEWQYMTGLQEFNKKHRIEENLTLNGQVLSYFKREPVPNANVYAAFMPFDGKHLFETYDYQTDSTGYFGFDLADFYDKAHFSIHLMMPRNSGNNKHVTGKRIRLERVDRPEPRHFLKQETDLDHNTLRPYDYVVDYTDNGLTPAQRRKLGKMIGDVDIEDDAGKIRFVDYDTFTTFEPEEDTELELDEGEFSSNIEDYLKDRGIIFGEQYSDMSLADYFKGLITGNWETNSNVYINPLFYCHNSKVIEWGRRELGDIDMLDVKNVIIYDEPKYLKEFLDLMPGVEIDEFSLVYDYSKYNLIDVQYKEDSQHLFDWEKTNLSSRVTKVKGFSRPVQFYSPQYPDGPIPGEIDSRRTLYWNPNVVTDYDGNARVEFYNNSFTKRFTISGAGITISGEPYVLRQNW